MTDQPEDRIDRLRSLVNLQPSRGLGDPTRKRRIVPPRAASSKWYVFKQFDNVFDETTLNSLRVGYKRAEDLVDLGGPTDPNGTYVKRNGRYDVALDMPHSEVSAFALTNMHNFGVNASVQTGVRALVLPRATKAQNWHPDLVTEPEDDRPGPRYLTLIVALEDMPADGDGLTEFRAPYIPTDGVLGGPGRASFNPMDESFLERPLKPVLRANQGILFDGRIMHRGGAATRRRPPMVYLVYTEPGLEKNV